MFLRRRLLSTAAAAAAARGPPPIRVSPTESTGRGVFATRPVSSGELLHSAQPLVAVPYHSLLHEVCYNCLRRKPGGGGASSGGYYFCSDACRDHAKGILGAANADCLNVYLYMAKRLACMVISGAANADCLNKLQPAQLKQQTLIGMKEEFELLESAFRKAGFQEDATYFLTVDWYINVWAKMRLNAFEIKSVGSAVYMLPSLYNHDCDPNAYMVELDNADIKLKAVRDVEEGEELRICYIDPSLDANARQMILALGYGFKCHCLWCLSGD